MPINNCRVCHHPFFTEPLLRYENMPCAAQHLPDKSGLAEEHGSDLTICQCSGCGLVQLSNDPVPYYREVIRATAFSQEMREFRLLQFSDFIWHQELRGKKILEVGCGRGEYLSLMEECGADTYGIEYAEASVTKCINDRMKVSRRYIEHSNEKLDNGPFDAFFILNYLEHLPNPNEVLTGVYNNLSENGVGLVEVPNFDMMLQKKLFSEFITDHLFYFTRATLISTLQLNGFDVIECKDIWHDYIISAVVKKRTKLDISSFYQAQQQVVGQIERYLGQFEPGAVAVWGAGHQALAVMSMANLQNKIKYVIDSAPFKQGKYTPATHIPIVSPQQIHNNLPAAIIVMAAAYSDEVVKTIQEKFGTSINIAILREDGLEQCNA
jgi:2-polyprenyl-3-methyl-5-hydroxy-6-metoxy-1,4-benzoquinol methylase